MFVIMNRNENFTYKAKRALFDYINNWEEDTGEETELNGEGSTGPTGQTGPTRETGQTGPTGPIELNE